MISYKEYKAQKEVEQGASAADKSTPEEEEDWDTEPSLPPQDPPSGASSMAPSQEDEWCFSSLLQGADPTAANSVLYLTFLTSLGTGAVSIATKLTLSSPASGKTDEAAFQEAIRALCCASQFILVKIAWNQVHEVIDQSGISP